MGNRAVSIWATPNRTNRITGYARIVIALQPNPTDHTRSAAPAMSPQSHYPKKIFSLWLQGTDHAPEIVKANWHRWRALNPDHELVILEGADAGVVARIGCQVLTQAFATTTDMLNAA